MHTAAPAITTVYVLIKVVYDLNLQMAHTAYAANEATHFIKHKH
jgi:hypothetical protein